MNKGYSIGFRRSTGNLHLYPNGEFNGMCAWALIKTIKQRYRGVGFVFVNTEGIEKVAPPGIRLFKEHMTGKIMPMDKLFIKGETGFKIGPNGSRVIIPKKQRKKKRSFTGISDGKINRKRGPLKIIAGRPQAGDRSADR